jgi:MoxR-like ATPase
MLCSLTSRNALQYEYLAGAIDSTSSIPQSVFANIICNVQYAWMTLRRALKTVQDALNRQAAVALLGPRQVGKTTLAHAVAEQTGALYLDLEARADRAAPRIMPSSRQTVPELLRGSAHCS